MDSCLPITLIEILKKNSYYPSNEFKTITIVKDPSFVSIHSYIKGPLYEKINFIEKIDKT